MPVAAKYNLCLEQGASMLPIIFVVRHSIVISGDSTGTTLEVFPLPHAVTAGTVLEFGGTEVTVSTTAAIGAEAIEISAITSTISAGITAKGDLVDLTGHVAVAHFKESFDSTSFIAFDCSIPENGKIQIALSYTKAQGLTANITPANASLISNLQSLSREDKKLLYPGVSPGVWDLQTYYGNPVNVRRWYYGEVLVTAGVTISDITPSDP